LALPYNLIPTRTINWHCLSSIPPVQNVGLFVPVSLGHARQAYGYGHECDFLIGQRFSEQTGVTLLDEYSVIDLYGTSTLLTHGDLLCTDDLPYQEFRGHESNGWFDVFA
jgi:hypothetical protein